MWPALAGFCLSAVGLPVLGVAAVAKTGGLEQLAGLVHPKFAAIFTLLIYLSIGPCVAIPRTASTSFEMAVLPWVENASVFGGGLRTVYSVVFFAVAMLMAMRPDKLTDRLGKILCPTLLVLIAVIFAGCLVWPMGAAGEATGGYESGAAVKGFLEGYQTMDTMAALNFGIIIALNIQARGVSEEHSLVRETILSGIIAGILMAAVYAALSWVGLPAGGMNVAMENGARVLTFMANGLFGRVGIALLGLIFLIACFNTCVGLLSCCSKYFSTIFPKIKYAAWVWIFGIASLLIANIGLDGILRFSTPVLNTIYPVAIALIALAFLRPVIKTRRLVYAGVVLFTGISSLIHVVDTLGVLHDAVSSILYYIPGYAMGLGWVIPGIVGGVLGAAASAFSKQNA